MCPWLNDILHLCKGIFLINSEDLRKKRFLLQLNRERGGEYYSKYLDKER